MYKEKFTDNKISEGEIAPYLLIALYQLGGYAHWTDAIEKTKSIIDASDELLNMDRPSKKHKGKHRNYFDLRTKFSRENLKISGHIKRPQETTGRGVWELSDLGKKAAKELIDANPDDESCISKLRREIAEKYKIHIENKNKQEASNVGEEELDENEILEEPEDLEAITTEHDLRSIVENVDPYEFELLCIELLNKMGADLEPTPKSNDGGIDGVGFIETGLLRFKVVIQMKRFDPDHKIVPKDIQALIGAMQGEAAEKAIFITTSSFTKTARETANKASIRLIDGKELIKLMQENSVGYKPKLNLSKLD